jgi:anaerobic selenocysteine-containing dehydrogenase
MEELRKTLCNRDCPDACAIVATVKDGRITQLRGDRDHPVTDGFLCFRTSQFLRTQYSPSRLTQPLLRRAGRLEPVDWDTALDFIAERLTAIRAESGPSAIFHYRSGGSLGLLVAQASELFFEQLGPTTVKSGDICSGAGEAAQEADFGVCDSNDLFDLDNARNIILWGKNVATSSPHVIPLLKRATSRGAGVMLIDPVHHRSASLCDAFVQPRPAADVELGMAVLRTLFDNDWLDRDAASYCAGLDRLRALARTRTLAEWCDLADVQPSTAGEIARRLREGPTSILVGWGMARRLRGGAIVRTVDALAAVTGNIGVPGAGVSYYYRRRRAFQSLTRGLPAPRAICEPLFGRELLAAADPPIRAVWITAGNPVAMLPDSVTVADALRSRELVVVADNWLSDTAELATVVLPVNTLLEADDLVGAYGHHHIGATRPIVEPPPSVKSDLEIFQALARRLGMAQYPSGDVRSLKTQLLSPELAAHDIDLSRLEAGAVRNPLAPAVLFANRKFPTPSGKVVLMDQLPIDDARANDPDYPLMLMSLSTPRSQSSQWAKDPPRPIEVTVHPDSAAGVAHGELARLESRVGKLTVRLLHDALQRRDVALIPKGGHFRDGSAANAITAARLTDIGQGGALYDERVRIAPVERDT